MTIFKWEIANVPYVHNIFPIVSPPFYIEPSQTFKFCLHLYPSGSEPLSNMILVLWRCDNNKSSIELEYELQFDANLQYIARNGTFTYNFSMPMEFPESRVHLTKPVSERGTLLKMTCKINSHSFEDIDKEVMRDLSLDYKTLLEKRTFSDLQYKFGNREFYFHKAILEARCDKLAEQLNSLTYLDPNILESIEQFLYWGKLTTWTRRIVQILQKFGSSLYKRMYPFQISEYSAKTSFVGNSFIFDWLIENYMQVRSETLYTYVILEDGTIMQLHFFPHRETDVPNFYMEIFGRVDYFVRCKVEIQEEPMLFTLAEMSNTVANPSSLVVNDFVPINWLIPILPLCIRNGAMKLKIHIHVSGFNEIYTSKVDAISYTNVYKDDMYMYDLRGDFKKLLGHSQYYDFVITVNYKMLGMDYERYYASYVRSHADDTTFDEDYSRMQAEYIKWNAHYARFRVHKAILSARSSVFSAELSRGYTETQMGGTEIDDIKPYVVHKMLLFMYCGELNNLNGEFAIDLYCAADKYDIKMLVQKCTEFLESNIGADNVDEIQLQARARNNESLNTACEQFRRRNINII